MTASTHHQGVTDRRRLVPAILCAAVLAACGGNPQPSTSAAPVDSAAIRARADSVAAAARRDSLARLARADSILRATQASRADSVRAEVLREGADTATTAAPSGLSPEQQRFLALPVHFETDRANLDSVAERLLEQKLTILRLHSRLEIEVQGHCDERESDEYNLALGNRRAATVRQWLVEHGVAAERITTVSYGEERPVDPRSTEDAWARNRRAEFVVTRSAS